MGRKTKGMNMMSWKEIWFDDFSSKNPRWSWTETQGTGYHICPKTVDGYVVVEHGITTASDNTGYSDSTLHTYMTITESNTIRIIGRMKYNYGDEIGIYQGTRGFGCYGGGGANVAWFWWASEETYSEYQGLRIMVVKDGVMRLNQRLTGYDLTQWHEYEIRLLPGLTEFLIDGVVVGSSSYRPSTMDDFEAGWIDNAQMTASGSRTYLDVDYNQASYVDWIGLYEGVESVQYNLVISSTAGGSTSPTTGTYAYDSGTQIPVSAIANSGYVFDHWELDGVNVGNANPYAITMNANHTLNAVFVAIAPPPPVDTFGNTIQGTTSGSIGNNIVGSIYTCPVTGYLKNITAQLSNYGGAWRSRAALYDGDTMAYLGSSDELTGPFPDGPVTFPFSQTIPVQANKKYGIFIWAEGSVLLSIVASYVVGAYVLSQTYTGEFPASLASATWNNIEGTYYATVSSEIPVPELSVMASPATASLTVGQSQTFAATVSGGTPPYMVNWIDNVSKSVIGTGMSYTFVATQAGTFQIYAEATDNAGHKASSNLVTITVSAVPPPPKYTLTVNSTPIQGVPITITKVS